MATNRPPAQSAEAGIVLVYVALIVAVLMVFAALAIDGGGSYATRRSMQNAADAGAMAGGLALYKLEQSTGSFTSGDVYDPAYAQAITHGGASLPTDGSDFCDLIDSGGNSLGVCPTAGIPPSSAVGVKINVENKRNSSFGSFAGQSTLKVRAHAASSIQPVGATGAPLIICGSSANSGYSLLTTDGPPDDGETPGLDNDSDNLADFFTPTTGLLAVFGDQGTNTYERPGSQQPDATMKIHVNSPKGATKCGASSSSADGKGDGQLHGQGDTVVSPGNGQNIAPNNNTSVPSGTCYNNGSPQTCVPCPTGSNWANSIPASGCDIILPVADWAEGVGNNATYHVANQAVFHIYTGSGDEKIVGFLDDPRGFQVTSAVTSSGTCAPRTQLCVVKLIDFPTNGFLE